MSPFSFYGHFRCLHVLNSNKKYIYKVLPCAVDSKLRGALKSPEYLANSESGGHRNLNCLQDNFHRPRAW